VTRALHTIVAGIILMAASAAAQTAPAQAPPAAAAQPSGAPAAPQEPQGGYTYDPAGRRDPFVSLVRRGSDSARSEPGSRPTGLAGIAVGELTLKGTMESRSGYVALVQGPDLKTYIAKPGDRLFDGAIRTITGNAMVLIQQVNDPLSLEKEREVRKTLRQTDEVK
jgi:type IV pilus assembly protein PilP